MEKGDIRINSDQKNIEPMKKVKKKRLTEKAQLSSN